MGDIQLRAGGYLEHGTHRFAGHTEIQCAESRGSSFAEGDIVRFSVDGQLQFYGWVFTKSKDRWGEIQVTCYDRIRYLKANASY